MQLNMVCFQSSLLPDSPPPWANTNFLLPSNKYLCFCDYLLCFLFWCCDSYNNVKLRLHIWHGRGLEYEWNWCIPYDHPSYFRIHCSKNFSVIFVKNSLSIIILLEVLVQRYSDHKFIFIYIVLYKKERNIVWFQKIFTRTPRQGRSIGNSEGKGVGVSKAKNLLNWKIQGVGGSDQNNLL